MTIEIIQLGESNMDIFNQYDEDIFDEKIDAGRLAAMLKEQNNILLAAVHDGVVIGQVLAVIHRHPDKPTELYIDDLGVSEKFQRRGIATRLLEQMYIIGVERGCEEVWVATEPDNEPAIKFYDSLNLIARKVIVFEGNL
ncbi:MAG: GNAT family N-acetyltransferase [Anaerolineales bacterium]|nr:GNAT family N-acetyltransferase [Anaerolineales bacterium]